MLFHNNNTEKYYRVIRSPVLITFPDDEENQKVKLVLTDGEKRFKCKYCGKELTNEWNYKLHKEAHEVPKKTCKLCGTKLLTDNYVMHFENCRRKPRYQKKLRKIEEEKKEKEMRLSIPQMIKKELPPVMKKELFKVIKLDNIITNYFSIKVLKND